MRVSEVLVTGGTGVLGRQVVERLGRTGVEVQVLSRSGRPGTFKGNLLTGAGLEHALRGVDTVIHCASNPYRKMRETEVSGTRRLLQAAAKAGVSHAVYISIVGVDRVPSYPYYKAKLDAEGVVESSAVPHTILRATQFYDLVLSALRLLERSTVMVVPKGLPGQPIDVGEVADRLVELALAVPSGRVPDIGGPEVRTLTDAARSYLDATGRRRIFELPLPGKTARAIRAGALTCPENAYGEKTWKDFLREKAVVRPGR